MGLRRKKYLIIDGYNVLRSGSRYKALTGPDYTDDTFNRAREVLIDDVVSYSGRDTEAVIVFDGGHNRYSTGEVEVIGGVKIMFSPAGSSADKVIEKLAFEARKAGYITKVVTSDATIQNTVFAEGVDRMSANGFSREMAMYIEDTRIEEGPQVARKTTLAGRIDASTKAKLEALRDSL